MYYHYDSRAIRPSSPPLQQPYQSPYIQPHYPLQHPPPQPQPPPPPPPPPQWSGENWSNYHSFPPPPPPIQDVPFNSGPGRPDTAPTSAIDQRHYPNHSTDPRRSADRPPITVPSGPLSTSPALQKRRRDKDNTATPPTSAATTSTSTTTSVALPDTPPHLDFLKLLDSYRLIIDSTDALSNDALSAPPGRPPPLETVERMLQSANYGVQMLESATLQQQQQQQQLQQQQQHQQHHQQPGQPPDPRPPPPPPPLDPDPDADKELGADDASASVQKRQKVEDTAAAEGQTCLGCNATSTPEWRRGPMGPRTLCNACGLVYAKMIKKRGREGGRPFGNGSGHGGGGGGKSNGNKGGGAGAGSHGLGGEDSGLASSGSDGEDSYGSQGRGSDGGGED